MFFMAQMAASSKTVDPTTSVVYNAVGGTASPGVYIYRTARGVTTELTLPVTFTNVKKVRWSPCGNYLAVATTASPYFGIFKRTGSTFTELSLASTSNVLTLPVYSIAWYPDSSRLIIGKTNSNKQVMIGVSGTTVSELLLYSAPSKSQANDMQFSPDGKYLAVGWGKNNGACGSYIYEYNATTHALSTKYTDTTIAYDSVSVDIVNNNSVPRTAFATKGVYVSMVYNLLTKYPCSTGESVGVLACTKMSPDGQWVLVARNTKPSAILYQYTPTTTMTLIGNPTGNSSAYGTIEVKFKKDGTGFYVASIDGATVYAEYGFDTSTGSYSLTRYVTGTTYTRATCDWVEVSE